MIVPEWLAATCRATPERRAWLQHLPEAIRDLQARWSLTLASPIADASCAWVAFATRSDGSRVVLKVGMPHMEAEHEIHGLRFWNGDGIVRLLDADEERNAMLLERCEPGTLLGELPEPEQDGVIAELLRRLWRKPSAPHRFRPLSSMLEQWTSETMTSATEWHDRGLVYEGLRLFEELSRPSNEDVLLTTDLHAGNVLRAQREPWLAIDPKPFIGDRAYDATQHLLNCRKRLMADPEGTIARFADLLAVDAGRARAWVFARAAAEPRDAWRDDRFALAKRLRV